MLNKQTRDKLETPFDKKYIKSRRGSFGKSLDYIEGHVVIQRLNDVFGSNWNFEILTKPSEAYNNGHIIVHVRLTVPNINEKGEILNWITKEHVGGKKVTIFKEDKSILDLASDYKASTTDALKKAATLLGIGLDLYGSDEKDAKEVEEHDTKSLAATSVQLSAISRIAQSKKLDNLDEFLKQLLGSGYTKLDSLTMDQAKQTITALNAYEPK